MQLDAENLNIRVNESEEVVVEPSYLEYLREHGFVIESVDDARTVASSSGETDHIIYEVTTYTRPRDHPELDYAADEITIRVCDCWSYRTNANDVEETIRPGGSCKHITNEFMAEKAKNDKSQQTL